MSVSHYRLSVLKYEDCNLQFEVEPFQAILNAWRNGYKTQAHCSTCDRSLDFKGNFTICCDFFYFVPTDVYLVQSIAVKTKGFTFLPKQLERAMKKNRVKIEQDFMVFPDPQYWHVSTTLAYDRMLRFVSGVPQKYKPKQPKDTTFYFNQITSENLTLGSLKSRTEGKKSFVRKYATAKRSQHTMRAVIVPAPFLKPNQVIVPKSLPVVNQWIIFNRMPTLTPENFVALKVVKTWDLDCLGIPLEIVKQLSADFDGDEMNGYIVYSPMSQAECATLLNSESNMFSYSAGIKLHPSQDMLAVYYLMFDTISFLPVKLRSLPQTLRTIYELFGSQKCFDSFDLLRSFYLNVFQNEIMFSISMSELEEMEQLGAKSFEEFEEKIRKMSGCLLTQIRSGANGTYFHLFQMVGSVGHQLLVNSIPLMDTFIKSSFLKGLSPSELVVHAQAGFDGLLATSGVWVPGYRYFKTYNNTQDIIVNYKGQLVDRDLVLATDAISKFHHEDLMSKATFFVLLNRHFGDADWNESLHCK